MKDNLLEEGDVLQKRNVYELKGRNGDVQEGRLVMC